MPNKNKREVERIYTKDNVKLRKSIVFLTQGDVKRYCVDYTSDIEDDSKPVGSVIVYDCGVAILYVDTYATSWFALPRGFSEDYLRDSIIVKLNSMYRGEIRDVKVHDHVLPESAIRKDYKKGKLVK